MPEAGSKLIGSEPLSVARCWQPVPAHLDSGLANVDGDDLTHGGCAGGLEAGSRKAGERKEDREQGRCLQPKFCFCKKCALALER